MQSAIGFGCNLADRLAVVGFVEEFDRNRTTVAEIVQQFGPIFLLTIGELATIATVPFLIACLFGSPIIQNDSLQQIKPAIRQESPNSL